MRHVRTCALLLAGVFALLFPLNIALVASQQPVQETPQQVPEPVGPDRAARRHRTLGFRLVLSPSSGSGSGETE